MKVAVTVREASLRAAVDQRFGRAPMFVVVDTETMEIEAVDNVQSAEAVQGAGIQAAETVVRSGAVALLTGHCGPKAFRALDAAGILVFTGVDGSVAEVLLKLRNGALHPAAAPDVAEHWA